MDSEPEKKSKLPILVIATIMLLFTLFPHAQNVIRQIELSDWKQAEGTVTIYEPFNDTFRYNYSVEGIEYTEWRYSFSWDTVSNSEGPLFEEYTRPETKNLQIYTQTENCLKILTFTLEPGAEAEVSVVSHRDPATDMINNFPEDTAVRVRIELVVAGGSREPVSIFENEPSNRTNLNLTEPGNYVITFSNQRQWWVSAQDWGCVGKHMLTASIYHPPNENFIEGQSITVHYDPNDPDFGVMKMPEFSGQYSSIGTLFAFYALAVYAIFNHESKPKGEEETSLTNPHSRSNWWEAQTE